MYLAVRSPNEVAPPSNAPSSRNTNIGSNYASTKQSNAGTIVQESSFNLPKLPCIALPKSLMKELEKNIVPEVMSNRNSQVGY
jgi:hypothetical protein